MSKPANLILGTLDMLILKLLAMGPLHGLAIRRRLQDLSATVLNVGDSALYPALHKLEAAGHVTAAWATSQNGRRAKIYSITPSGRVRLRNEVAGWERTSAAISAVVVLAKDCATF